MNKLNSLIKQYNSLNITQSKDEFSRMKIEYVYHSNRLEGSNLTIIQTEDVINLHQIKGEASIIDGVMAIDNYRALGQALSFGANKYPLNENMLLSLHSTLLKNTFELDPGYNSVKSKGQKLGEYKTTSNRILFTQGTNKEYFDTPTPKESAELVKQSLSDYQNSKDPFVLKLSKLLQNIYNAHPFFDGNKRMTRLIIANQLIANGYPLIVLHRNKNTYNEALINGFINQTHEPLMNVLLVNFKQFYAERIQEVSIVKKPKKGFNYIL